MNRTVRLTPRQRVILAASFTLATQGLLLAAPPATPAPVGKAKPQSPAFKYAGKFIKFKGQLTVIGLLNGAPVFKNPRGECFRVEPGTGDLTFLDPASFGEAKRDLGQRQAAVMGKFIKWGKASTDKGMSILGLDSQGHVIQENARGERFYLDPNGDMVFVK